MGDSTEVLKEDNYEISLIAEGKLKQLEEDEILVEGNEKEDVNIQSDLRIKEVEGDESEQGDEGKMTKKVLQMEEKIWANGARIDF